jgi:hypothetical protein
MKVSGWSDHQPPYILYWINIVCLLLGIASLLLEIIQSLLEIVQPLSGIVKLLELLNFWANLD